MQVVIFLLFVCFFIEGEVPVIGGLPALLPDDLAFGVEAVTAYREGELHFLIFRRRHEHRQEAAHHQVVDVLLRTGQIVKKCLLLGGDNGVVICDLGVVDQIFGL